MQVAMVEGVVGAIVEHAITAVASIGRHDTFGRIVLHDLDVSLHLVRCLVVGSIALVEMGEEAALGIDEVAHEDVGDGEALVGGDAALDLEVFEEEDERALAILARPDDLALGALAGEEGEEIVGKGALVSVTMKVNGPISRNMNRSP